MFFNRSDSSLQGPTARTSRSSTTFLRRLSLGAAVALAALIPCNTALAAWGAVAIWSKDNGNVVIIAEDDSDGSLWWFEFDEDDNVIAVQYLGEDNPNPDDGTTTPGDRESWEALLKQRGGGGLQTNFEKTPVGKYLLGKGKGIGPVHNPGDDDGEGGVSPSSTKFKDPKEDLQEVGGEGHIGNAGGIDGNGGPIGGQLEDLGRKKGTNGSNNDGDTGAKPEDGGLWGPEMPGPPELVNPNPARGADRAMELFPFPGTGWSNSNGSMTVKNSYTGRAGAVSAAAVSPNAAQPGGLWAPAATGPTTVNAGLMQSTGFQSMGATMSPVGVHAAPANNVMRAIR